MLPAKRGVALKMLACDVTGIVQREGRTGGVYPSLVHGRVIVCRGGGGSIEGGRTGGGR